MGTRTLTPVCLTVFTAFWGVHGFNLETDNPVTFSEDPQSQFGLHVAQFNADSQKWTLVSAPLLESLNQNKTGAIYKCLYNDRRCTKLNTPVPRGSENMGLSLTTGNSNGPKFLGCVPRYSYHCYTNTYINGYCEVFNTQGAITERIPSKLPVCPKVLVDIAFLIDGSGSVDGWDFRRMKDFIKAIMRKFRNAETQMALAQFSHYSQTEFTFNNYNQASDKERLVDTISQIQGGTNTPDGINYVTNAIFSNTAGARNGAKRILITITDGQSQNTNFNAAIDGANRKKIQRYAIGVGSAFSSSAALNELRTIASKNENVFRVDNFAALDGIQKELQEKIFAIEGASGPGTSASFQLEMAQEGFSSLITSSTKVLGAVGAYDWSGALIEIRGSSRITINSTLQNANVKNAYLGYTVKEARKGRRRFYVTGAPRYQHKGQVLIFEGRILRDHIVGLQIGSYFGSEVCPVDLNEDGQTDLLLVGAPMYHRPRHGGMVTVYTMGSRGALKEVGSLQGQTGQTLGRFGSAIAQLTDLNGDGYRDVAIGAPLENAHSGAIYIYHGTKDRIKQTASQRIESSAVGSGLRYFGQAIDGAMDISGDGLTDITVGAQGKVFILRSRPVMEVTVSMTFSPNKILLKHVDCPENRNELKVDVNICFKTKQLTTQVQGTPSLNISYELKLDEHRKIERATLTSQTRGTFQLTAQHCLAQTIQVKNCIQDFLNPIELNVVYTGEGVQSDNNPAPIIQSGNTGSFIGNLPFEKECGEDNICRDYLRVRLAIVGAQFIVVGSYSTLTLDVTLQNADENSYFTVVTYRVPTGLTFRKTSIISSKRRAHIECDDSKNSKYAAVGIVTCDVNHPIFRSNSTIRFNTTFDVASDVEWKSSEEININATSDNDQRNMIDSFVARTIGVKYEVNVIIKGIESTQYVNFSSGSAGEKPVQHIYRVENIGLQSLPVNITFVIPVKIGPGLSWEQVIVNTTEGSEQNRVLTPESGQQVDWHRLMPSNDSQVCNISTCRVLVYQLQQLRHRSSIVFSLTGLMKWTKPNQVRAQEVSLTSYAAAIYDTNKYIHVSQATNQFQQAMVTTSVEIVEEFNSLPIIIGSSIGGLVLLALAAGILYKVGFFNRNYKDKLQENAGDDGPGGVPAEQSPPDTATA